ncbi:M20 family peptidase [Balneolaceae bacterium ANBcel3]|nr:M20 family peptidase [Balneolaceae bacterium ANBcel3]
MLLYRRHRATEKATLPDLVNMKEASERLSQVIQLETISVQKQEQFKESPFLEIHHVLERMFPLTHQNLKREIIQSYSLLFTWPGENSDLEPVMFTSHLDVVPVEPGTQEKWKYPPFSGKIADGFIWGRGAMDVKGGVMAILEAVEGLLERGFTPDRTVILAFGHDEEIDGIHGACQISRILKDRGVKLKFLLDEGTPVVENAIPGLKKPVALVSVAEKGYLSLRLTAKGEGGHSSVPRGMTSIAKLGKALYVVEKYAVKARMDTLMKKTMESIGPNMSFPYRLIMANLWLFKWLVKKKLETIPATKATLGTTVASTLFQAGIKENVLPAHASAVINFRIHPNDSVNGILNKMEKLLRPLDVEIEALDGSINPSPVSETEGKTYELLQKAIETVFPEAVMVPALMVGATDARHYQPLSDHVYRFTPLRTTEDDLDRVHGTNERISVENYREMICFYDTLISASAQK